MVQFGPFHGRTMGYNAAPEPAVAGSPCLT